jgi:hypothetical protein
MTREELIEVMARAICAGQGLYWEDQFSIRSSNGDPLAHEAFQHDAAAALAAIEAAGVRLVPVEVEKVAIDVGASLAAAISLLERGGERAAPSRKMFNVMLTDYKKSLARARAYFNSPATLTKDTQ